MARHAHIAPKPVRRKLVSLAGVAALLAGFFTVVNTPEAIADVYAPGVEVNEVDSPYIAGEDLELAVTFSSPKDADAQYNLSAGVMLPSDVTVTETGTLGAPRTFSAGDEVPGQGDCTAVGLEQAAGMCTVPQGSQYLVFTNISDLPAGAETTHTLELRPNAETFGVGAELPVTITGFTSNDERFIPAFPGTRSVAAGVEHTSGPGSGERDVVVNALRVEKTEPSPEDQLLRGVHDNVTTYTIRVYHTGEGDIANAKVVDYLPAGLEFLGLGGADNTTNANGTRADLGQEDAALEYGGAAPLTATQAPEGPNKAWPDDGVEVETVLASIAADGTVTEDEGEVYTKVTWDMGALAATDYEGDTTAGTTQSYPSAAGTAGYFELHYRAAVPLFENTMDFGETTPPTTGEQASNLDNNRGASTRHGSATLDEKDAAGKSYTNYAFANGTYGDDAVAVEAHGAETIEAVDVRLVKSFDGDEDQAFSQNGVARYNLNIRTSEYVGLSMPTEADSGRYDRPVRLVDDLADGICPALPEGTPVTPGVSDTNGQPYFAIGDPNKGTPDQIPATDWNEQVSVDVAPECSFPSSTGEALAGGTLTGLIYDPDTGHFFLDLALDTSGAEKLAASNATHDVSYSAFMANQYSGSEGANGATTSGDLVANTAEIQGRTNSIEELDGVESSSGAQAYGEWTAWDDSRAELRAAYSALTKQVLPRAEGVPVNPAEVSGWVDSTDAPFAVGDEVWYKISLTPPAGADVRNGKLTDFLPQGSRLADVVIKPSDTPGLGACEPADEAAWINTFVTQSPATGASDDARAINWELGNTCGLGGTDRFFPGGVSLDVFVKVVVTEQSAFNDVDLAQNLAKYQQNNVDGDVFFLRDDAEVSLAQSLQLLKGIRSINGETVGGAFNSNVDHKQVVQGDSVTFRIDITAPEVASTGYVVWDALPEGITKADVAAGSPTTVSIFNGESESPVTDQWSAIALDPGDSDYPDAEDLNSAYEGRSLIVWNLTDVEVPASTPAGDSAAVKRGVSLGYTIIVPDGDDAGGALAGQSYDNTASVVSYDSVTNGGGTATHVPTGDGALSTAEPTEEQYSVPGKDTVDSSDIYLDGPKLSKTVASTEVAPTDTAVEDLRNPVDAIVEGEYVTYDLSVTLPKKTTIRGGVLADDGRLTWTGSPNTGGRELEYEVAGAQVWNGPGVTDGVGSLPTEWVFNQDVGTLTFPDYYRTGDEDETVSVRITAWIGEQGQAFPDFSNGKALNNHATFTSKTVTGEDTILSDDATVTYVDPSPALTKRVTSPEGGKVGANGEVAFELTASNEEGRPALYDVTVRDCVPEALTGAAAQAPEGTSVTIAAEACDYVGGAITDSGTGTLIIWTIPRIDGGQEFHLPYSVTVNEEAGGAASFTNHAEVTGHTLPSDVDDDDATGRRGVRTANANATVTLAEAAIEKTVTPESAPVGETVEYTVTTTLPPNANFYDFTLTDTLPDGLKYDETIGMTTDWGGADGKPVSVTGSASDQHLAWTFKTEDGADIADVMTHSQERTITVKYTAKITAAVTDAAPQNTAAFAWNSVKGQTDTQKTVTSSADVTLLNPQLDIVKQVDGEDEIERNPDASFDYSLAVMNTGNTPAHNVTVVDEVPAGVIVDPTTITLNGELTGSGEDGSGGTITWTLAGPLNVHTDDGGEGQVINLTYSGKFIASEDLDADAQVNTASVTRYESFESDGWVYEPGTGTNPGGETVARVTDTASVTPIFPYVQTTKSVTDGPEAFVGEPFSWTIELENTGNGDAQTVTVVDTLPANWTYDEGSTLLTIGGEPFALGDPANEEGSLTWTLEGTAAEPALPAGAAATIVFTATPQEGAWTDAGAGLSIGHTNTVSATATDTTGTEKPEYSGDDDTADAQIAAADLTIEKVAGDPILAGTEGPGWSITVSNDGPDEARGPITVTDALTDLPAGVTITSATGDGWDCRVPTEGDGGAGFDCARTDEAQSLASGAEFPEITVNVRVDADQAPTEIPNTATVNPGRTHDPDPGNNESNDPLPTGALADLAIEKEIATDSPTAGEAISWTLSPRNEGPSVSWVSEENPITITDVIPAGITDVEDPSAAPVEGGAGWTATATNGFPANAGDEITWTYVPAAGTEWMPVAAAPEITLTGTIDPSWTSGAIENTATITPGDTEDEDPENNTSTVTVTPGDGTSITVAKTRVVNSGGEWVAPGENDTVAWGEQVHYRVDVANNGPADARNVRVVDETPEGLTYAGHDNLDGTWTRTSGGTSGGETNADWETFALDGTQPVGQTRSFVVTFDTDPAVDPETVIENWVEATADNSDPDRDDDESGSTWRANLSIEKSHTGENAVAGETLDYTLLVTNHGPSTSAGPIVVTDDLPAGFSYVPGTAAIGGNAAEPVIDGQRLTWTAVAEENTFDVGATLTIAFTVAIDPSLPAQAGVVNTGSVDGPNDPDPSDDESPDPVDVTTSADMSVTKDVEAGPWVAGTPVTYTVTVAGDGPSAARNVRLADTVLDPGITLTSIAATSGLTEGWDCPEGLAGATTSTACEFDGAYPAGEETTFTVTGLIDSNAPEMTDGEDPLLNEARLTWTDSRGTGEDSDDAGITVSTLADLAVQKRAIDADGDDTDSFVAGEQGRYAISVRNDGPSAAAGPIVVTDDLPEGLTFVRVEGTEWAAEADGQTVTFTRDAGLANGASAPEIVFTVYVDPGVTDGDDLTNTATGESGTDDPNEENNTGTSTVQVDRQVDVTPAKTHTVPATGVDEFEVGQDVDFRITATNAGPSHASGITITESLPTGLKFIEAGGEDWELTSQDPEPSTGAEDTALEFVYTGTLAAGETTPDLTVTAQVTVDVGSGSAATNEVCVDAAETNTADDPCASDTVPVVPIADLSITKTVETDAEEINAGEPLTWLLSPRNEGPSASVSTADAPITITDTLPAGVAAITADPSTDEWAATTSNEGGWQEATAGDEITWTFTGGTLEVGTEADIRLTVLLDAAWYDADIPNTATITPGQTRDPAEPNNSDDVTVTPGDVTGLDVWKNRVVEVDGEWVPANSLEEVPPFNPGAPISYEIIVANTGPADARDVTVVDPIPTGLSNPRLEQGAPQWTLTGTAECDDDAPTDEQAEAADCVTFTFGQVLRVGASQAASFVVTFDTDPGIEGDVVNLAQARATNVPTEDWPTAEDSTGSTAYGDLALTKTADTGEALAGEQVGFTLVVENVGPSNARGPVTVTDTLPEGMTYVEGSARLTLGDGEASEAEPQVEEAAAGQVLTWQVTEETGTLAPADTVTITLTAELGADFLAPEELVNIAVVDSPDDENPFNNEDTGLVTLTPVANLSVEKTVETPEEDVSAGRALTWLIAPRNEGPSASVSTADAPITITDTLPDGVAAITADPSTEDWAATTSNEGGWQEATAGDEITWTYTGAVLQVGAEPDIRLSVLLEPGWTGGDITNAVTIAPGETRDPVEEDNSDDVTVTPGDGTALEIWKNRVVNSDGEWVAAASLDPVPQLAPGTEVSYRIAVVNNGPADARDVSVVDAIPAGLSNPRVEEGSAWTLEGTAECDEGIETDAQECATFTLAGVLGVGTSAGSEFIVTFDTDPALDTADPVVNLAQVRAINVPADQWPTAEDSSDSTAYADLALTKTADSDEVPAGGQVGFTLAVENVGPSNAGGPVTITDTLPAGMSYVAGSAQLTLGDGAPVQAEPDVEDAGAGQVLTWQVTEETGSLAPGDTVTLTLRAQVGESSYAPEGLVNVAVVDSPDDENPFNNEDSAAVIVTPISELAVTKTAVGAFEVGKTGTYEITVENLGPTLDPGPIRVVDELPEGLTFVSSEGATVDGDTITWVIDGGLQVGETATFTLQVDVGEKAYPSVTNGVTVTSPTPDTPGGDGQEVSDEETVTVEKDPGTTPPTGISGMGLWALVAVGLLAAGTLAVRQRRT